MTGFWVLIAGCSLPGAANPEISTSTPAAPIVETTAAPLIMSTETVAVTVVPVDESTPAAQTAESQETEDPAAPLEGETTVLSINMRSGPSTIHEVAGTYNIGTVVTIVGRTPDNSWYYVQPRDNKFGWMYASYLRLYSDQASIAEIIPSPAIVFRGQVINTLDQSGVDGVDIAIVQGTDEEILRAETFSIEDGSFEVFLPATISGVWRVVIVGVNCESKIMSEACTYTGSFKPDLGITFTLPDIPELIFTYTP
jgi:hypothetical protein